MADFEVDGKELLEQMLYMHMLKEDPQTAKVIGILRKYGMDIMKGLAMIYEIGIALGFNTTEGDTD